MPVPVFIARLKTAAAGAPATVRGASWMLLGAAFNALLAVMIRFLSDSLHPFEIAFFRSLFGVCIFIPWMWHQRVPSLQLGRVRLFLIRAAVGAVAMLKAAADFPVVGYIEKRDRTIIIKAGPKGPVYSVKTADGKVLYENLSRERLSAQAPELGEFLKSAVAGSAGKSGAVVDASIRSSAIR